MIGIVMGSHSDWSTMECASTILDQLKISYAVQIVSAHRTPDLLFKYAENAHINGFKVIIAGAGGSAHLPGMLAAKTHIPILGVPILSKSLKGIDSLLSIAQMPKGIPVATFAIGKAGAVNAALFAAAILAVENKSIVERLKKFRAKQTKTVLKNLDPRQ